MTKEYDALRKQAEKQTAKSAELKAKLEAISDELAKLEIRIRDAIAAGDDETYMEVYASREKLLTKQNALQSMTENLTGAVAYEDVAKAWQSVKPSFDRQIEKAAAEYVKARAACFAAYVKVAQARNEALKERTALYRLTGAGDFERTEMYHNAPATFPRITDDALNRIFEAELSASGILASNLSYLADSYMPSGNPAL